MKNFGLLFLITVFFAVLPISSSAATIVVLSATYGQNCGVRSGNVTVYVSVACNGKSSCAYQIDARIIGDPAAGCEKDFVVDYSCTGVKFQSSVSPEASGQTIKIACVEVINVNIATYGRNCGVQPGNVTADVSFFCDERTSCNYHIDSDRLGDPAIGCAKDFGVTWICGQTGRAIFISPEASGKRVLISCD